MFALQLRLCGTEPGTALSMGVEQHDTRVAQAQSTMVNGIISPLLCWANEIHSPDIEPGCVSLVTGICA